MSNPSVAAVERIEQAVGDAIKERDGDDGRYLTDWVVFAATRGLEVEDCRYSWIVPVSRPPYHVLVGLIRTCQRMIEDLSDEDDD